MGPGFQVYCEESTGFTGTCLKVGLEHEPQADYLDPAIPSCVRFPEFLKISEVEITVCLNLKIVNIGKIHAKPLPQGLSHGIHFGNTLSGRNNDRNYCHHRHSLLTSCPKHQGPCI